MSATVVVRSCRLLGALCLSSVLAGAPGGASASPLAPLAQLDQTTKAQANAKFREGERAFKRHEYAAAAAAFEEAYSIAPHPAALFNAATAHQKAGRLSRAANLCARYLRDAPADDSRREKANALLGELTPKLGRIQIEDRGALDVQLDGEPAEDEVTYVDPGDHAVTGRFGDKTVQRKISVVAGSSARVALEPPKAAAGADEDPEPDPDDDGATPVADTKPAGKGLSPTLFYVGVGATVVLGGVTIWSGLDTSSARDEYDQNPTQAGLDEGRSKQSRTNLLLGATAVVAVGTAVVGLFFTDFEGKKPPAAARTELLVGPRFVGARGAF